MKNYLFTNKLPLVRLIICPVVSSSPFNFIFTAAFSTTEWRKEDDNKNLHSSFTPVVYSNAAMYKKEIIKDNQNKSGIYCWNNLISTKKYIGSSTNLGRRFKVYFSDYYLNDSNNRIMPINKALKKYGHDNFSSGRPACFAGRQARRKY